MGQTPSVMVLPTRTQRLNAPGNTSASDQDCAAFFDPWRSGTLRHISRPVSAQRGLIGSVWGTSLRACEGRLCTQLDVMSARARARPRAPKVGSPASTLLRSNEALESANRTGRNNQTWRSEHRVRSNSARIVYSDRRPPSPKKARSVFSPRKGGGAPRVARARPGVRGNLLPARIQRARRHVSLSDAHHPSGSV